MRNKDKTKKPIESNQELLPKLRFPEFRDAPEWSMHAIGKITQVRAGATPDTSNLKYWGGNIPWMNSGELNQKRVYEVSNRITSLGLKESSTKLVPPGCILIGLAGQGKTRGTAAINYIELCTNQSIASIFPNKNKFVSEFLFHQMDLMYGHLRSLSKGEGGRGGLNLQIIKSLEIPFPSLMEQQQIADCLFSLDELLDAVGQKLKALKEYKKALMQQLFPAEGETLPRLRFPEFQDEGEWEEKTLSDLCNMQAGKFIPAAEIYEEMKDGLYPCYGGNGQRGFVRNSTHTGKYPLIGRQGALCGNINMGTGTFYATEHAVVVTVKKHIDVDWLYYQLIRLNLNQYATGQAQPGLSVEVLERVTSITPSNLEEQQKIADFFLSLDVLIAKQSEKFDALKEHKKGLMQQLFPAVSEVQG